MEYRYVIIGTNVLILSGAFLVFGLLTGNTVVTGVSLSFTVLGAVVLTLGLTYVEPLSELMVQYARDLSTYLTKLLEDAGIVSNYRLTVCRTGDYETAVFSERGINCSDVRAGVGLIGESAYVAVPLPQAGSRIPEWEAEGTELADYLRNVLVTVYGLCRNVTVRTSSSEVSVELIQPTGGVSSFLKEPVNPVKLLVLMALSRYFRSSIELTTDSVMGDTYLVKARVRG